MHVIVRATPIGHQGTQLPAAVVWAAGCLTVALASLMIHVIAQVAQAKNGARAAAATSAATAANSLEAPATAAV